MMAVLGTSRLFYEKALSIIEGLCYNSNIISDRKNNVVSVMTKCRR